MFKAYICNLSKYNEGLSSAFGRWVDFPIYDSDLFDVILTSIGINDIESEWVVLGYESEYEYDFNFYLGETPSYNDLQNLGEVLEQFKQYCGCYVGDVLECADINSIDIRECDPSNFTIYCGVESHEDLGRYTFKLMYPQYYEIDIFDWYFDFERYGERIATDERGAFTNNGYTYCIN